METHRYTLQRYSGPASRYTCPECLKVRCFVRYIDSDSGEHLAEHVGRCNREVECGYHRTPKQFFDENPAFKSYTAQKTTQTNAQPSAHTTAQEPTFLPRIYLEKSLSSTNPNYLMNYLNCIMGVEKAQALAGTFKLGAATRWPGASVFWYVDAKGNIRSGKIILYDQSTGKRVKVPYSHIDWVHSILKKKGLLKNFNFKMCLFGEHQILDRPGCPIGIVESEKTAIISSAYLPDLIWMASGSVSSITPERLTAIKGHYIILYPDVKAYSMWEQRAQQLRKDGFRVSVSSFLESGEFVTEQDRQHGLDLGDYLPRLQIPKSQLEQMEAKNPALREMIKRFDLQQNEGQLFGPCKF